MLHVWLKEVLKCSKLAILFHSQQTGKVALKRIIFKGREKDITTTQQKLAPIVSVACKPLLYLLDKEAIPTYITSIPKHSILVDEKSLR